MENTGIVRHSLKIQSIIKNARVYLSIDASGISFSDYTWQFVDGKTIINTWSTKSDLPGSTDQSDKMAKALKQRGLCMCGHSTSSFYQFRRCSTFSH